MMGVEVYRESREHKVSKADRGCKALLESKAYKA
jgi:hypothetical protein